jgi:hypothetical protein
LKVIPDSLEGISWNKELFLQELKYNRQSNSTLQIQIF